MFEDSDWASALEAVLRDPDQPRLVFQPVVDLRRGVIAGYETLARFDAPPWAAPDMWFAAAGRLGVGARLEARVVKAALEARHTMPEDCFLTVNVSPHMLGEPELIDVMTAAPDLEGLVVELTEHVPIEEHGCLLDLLNRLRAAGATVALDDAGSGYSGLREMALLRPEMVKIDRALVAHVDRDEAKLAVAELLGSYAGRLDAVVIAEGLERTEELEALIRLGIPLGQGWLLGRPGPSWVTLPEELAEQIRALAARSDERDRVGGLVERTATILATDVDAAGALFAGDPGLELVAVIDVHHRVVCLLRRHLRSDERSDVPQVLPVTLRVTSGAGIADVATRAMTRAPAARFDPVVCGDAYGGYLGVIRPERLMLRLAEMQSEELLGAR